VNRDSLGMFGDELSLVVPPYSEFLRAVRLVAADAAVRAGLDCEETEDFRLAVDELCHTLMSATDHSIHVSFSSLGKAISSVDKGSAGRTTPGVVAHGSTVCRNGKGPVISQLSATIVEALSDRYELRHIEDRLEFVVTRQMAVRQS
jgi:hypothetical protein